ncbi:hypothetical protein TIFTF001_034024 [Ficus carica]|uniref:Uncharacterized protein n=1 Tax=Ficus carica TaxID=3494 RepID=A0AA88DZT5_FICCA|nr:hypothetical protein TIFTF001_034024 [Ficus carica]
MNQSKRAIITITASPAQAGKLTITKRAIRLEIYPQVHETLWPPPAKPTGDIQVSPGDPLAYHLGGWHSRRYSSWKNSPKFRRPYGLPHTGHRGTFRPPSPKLESQPSQEKAIRLARIGPGSGYILATPAKPT